MSFPRYPEYKDSGVEWLGDVPAHWSITRFKLVFSERMDRSERGDELLLSVSAYTGVSPRSEVIDDGDHLSRAESLEGYKKCFKDDLVMNIMLAWNRGLAFTSYDGIVSPAYCVFRVIDGSDPKFLNYLVRSNEYTLYFKAFSTGVIDSRLRIYPETFGALFCALPSLGEQKSIATFLDRETAKIDALVAEQEKLIALLQEKRQAVISHAVTKGLDPNVPMKDSGVEWLGEVPGHWNITKLGHYARLRGGFAFAADDFGSEGIQVVRMNNLKRGTLDMSLSVCVKEEKIVSGAVLRAGDLVFGMSGSIGETGSLGNFAKVREYDLPCLLNQRVGRFDVLSILSIDYLEKLIQAQYFNEQVILLATGTAQFNISSDQVQSCIVAVAPIDEQVQISRYITEFTARLDELIFEAQSATTLLQERRTALISAAVTGQIDVRGLAGGSDAPDSIAVSAYPESA